MNYKATTVPLFGQFSVRDIVRSLAAEGCLVIHGGRPKNWTCIKERNNALAHPEKYGDPLFTWLRERRDLCWSCAATDALKRSGFIQDVRPARKGKK